MAQTTQRRNNRRGQGERLREELLDAAAELVAEHGDGSGLSLRAVAAKVGVAATSVYLHFADLDALRTTLAQRCFTEFARVRDAAAEGITDPARALLVRSQAYVDYALANPGSYRLMFARDLPLWSTGPAGDTASRGAFDALVESIARCQRAGVASDRADPRRLAVLVWTGLHGQVALRMDRPGFPWPDLEETIADLVTRLVGLTVD